LSWRLPIFFALILVIVPGLQPIQSAEAGYPDNQPKYSTDNPGELLSTKEYLTGRIDYYRDTNFVEIPVLYAYRSGMYLLKETHHAFAMMYQAAKKDGVDLKIISATRTHTEQSWIWEDKWKKNASRSGDAIGKIQHILQFSAMPGTSRHHWGTEIDLNSLSNSYFEQGTGKIVYEWLQKNACEYGFCQVYDENYKQRLGHGEEKWHWSYFPLASRLPELYNEKVQYSDISGFSGSEYAGAACVIEDYVLGVVTVCCNNHDGNSSYK
jgi:LAS superfamily LD-carboxypeptidase LdcB